MPASSPPTVERAWRRRGEVPVGRPRAARERRTPASTGPVRREEDRRWALARRRLESPGRTMGVILSAIPEKRLRTSGGSSRWRRSSRCPAGGCGSSRRAPARRSCCVHAGIACLESWDALAPLLAAAGYRVVRYDARGWGRSTTDDVRVLGAGRPGRRARRDGDRPGRAGRQLARRGQRLRHGHRVPGPGRGGRRGRRRPERLRRRRDPRGARALHRDGPPRVARPAGPGGRRRDRPPRVGGRPGPAADARPGVDPRGRPVMGRAALRGGPRLRAAHPPRPAGRGAPGRAPRPGAGRGGRARRRRGRADGAGTSRRTRRRPGPSSGRTSPT